MNEYFLSFALNQEHLAFLAGGLVLGAGLMALILRVGRNKLALENAALMEKVGMLEAQIETQQTEYESIMAAQKSLEALKTELDKALDVEKSKSEQLAVTLDKNEQATKAMLSQLEALNQRHANAKEALAREEQLNRSNAEKIHDLERRRESVEQSLADLRAEHAELLTKYAALQERSQEQLESAEKLRAQAAEQKVILSKEFENLANKIFDEKGQRFSDTSNHALNTMLKPFREQIKEFRERVDTIHKESYESNTLLQAQLNQLKDMNQQVTQDAQNLTKALKGDKKLSGTWGEIQLEHSLQTAGLIAGDHYAREESFATQEGLTRRPDFVINLPDSKHMIIDSKVSLVDYDAAVAAESDEQANLKLDAHVRAVKRHIDSLAAKDYSNLIGIRSPNFVLMFMPIEPAYIEAMKHNKELFNYGYEKSIIMVSHTTLMPILRTVANLWMVERSNKEAREIGSKAGEIYNQVCTVADRVLALGKTLGTANKHYNSTVLGLVGKQGLYGKVERFTEIASNVTKTMPKLEPQHVDFDYEKLELKAEEVVEKQDTEKHDIEKQAESETPDSEADIDKAVEVERDKPEPQDELLGDLGLDGNEAEAKTSQPSEENA